jgi:hypothetical protein
VSTDSTRQVHGAIYSAGIHHFKCVTEQKLTCVSDKIKSLSD